MRWVLDCFYLLAILIVGPFWCVRRLLRRRPVPPLRARLGWVAPLPPHVRRIWVHGVSVGEVLAARGLVAALRADGMDVLVTSTTVAGLATARREFGAECVRAAPLDFSCSVRRFLSRCSVRALVLMELELWPNLLLACASNGIPVAVANAKLSERSLRGWRKLARAFPRMLDALRMVATQSDAHAARFVALGLPAERVRTCGNLKFDNVTLLARETSALQARKRLGFGATDPVVVAGSTHPGEEFLICEAIAALRRTIPNLRLVLAPRHLERLPEVNAIAGRCGRVGLLTRAPDPGGAEVVVVDTMGELATLYALADVAFVGGTLVPVGGHNLLEPAAYGVPILTGPHTATVQAQREELVREGAMCVMDLSSASECEKMIHSILSDPDSARRARAGAAHLFAANAGSLPRTMQALATVLPTKEPFHHG